MTDFDDIGVWSGDLRVARKREDREIRRKIHKVSHGVK